MDFLKKIVFFKFPSNWKTPYFTVFLLISINNPPPKSYLVTAQGHCCQSHPSVWTDEQYDQSDTPPTQKLEGIPTNNVVQHCDLELGQETCSKQERYILYDVNPGEGFNLRRDIFVRIAPLIKTLNAKGSEWVLVLPPWAGLPHWKSSKSYPWETFFELEELSKYIPVLEFESFLKERTSPNIDLVLNLRHFPLPGEGDSWEEAVQVDQDCGRNTQFKFQKESSLWQGRIFDDSLTALTVKCVSLRGSAATLSPFLQKEGQSLTSLLITSAEVILWDEYGGEEWWRARAAMKFARNLVLQAKSVMRQQSPNYLGVHLRRRDFLLRKNELPPSIQSVADQILVNCQKLNIFSVFLATDGEEDELAQLQSLLGREKIVVWNFPCGPALSEGECAILDQILASESTHFIGTEGSTFTLRIFEERLLLGKSPESTYNIICNKVTTTTCSKPTQWLIPDSLKHLINYSS